MKSKAYKIITLYNAVLDLKEAKKWYKTQSNTAVCNTYQDTSKYPA